MEITPEFWVKSIIDEFSLLKPDIQTVFCSNDDVQFNIDNHFKIINQYISFDIETVKGKITLEGVCLDAFNLEDKRSVYDILFVPMGLVNQIGKRTTTGEIFKIGYLVNIGSISNIIFLKQPI